jgi:hypothetical protein
LSDFGAGGASCGVNVCNWASRNSSVNTRETSATVPGFHIEWELYITVVTGWAGTLVVAGELVELEAALDAGVELEAGLVATELDEEFDAGLDDAALVGTELDAGLDDDAALVGTELDAADVGVVELAGAVVKVELETGAVVEADEAGVDVGVVITDVVVETADGVV